MGKVLVAYDGSEISQKAIERAATLLAEADSMVLLLVVPEGGIPNPAGFGDLACPEEPMSREEANLLVNAAASEAASRYDVRAVGVVRMGKPGPIIVQAVEEFDATVVVVGVGRVEKVSCFALGSVADYVARHSSTPVLIVR
jgi:nucleotide-binding universal stress UspA family protein